VLSVYFAAYVSLDGASAADGKAFPEEYAFTAILVHLWARILAICVIECCLPCSGSLTQRPLKPNLIDPLCRALPPIEHFAQYNQTSESEGHWKHDNCPTTT
jgi:hypothetical protein